MDYVATCPRTYFAHTQPEAFFMQRKMIEDCRRTGSSQAFFGPNNITHEGKNTYWAYLVSRRAFAHSEITRFVNYLGVQDFKIKRFHADQFEKERGSLVILRALVEAKDGEVVCDERARNIESHLKRVKYLDDDVLLAYERLHPTFSLEECEILMALGTMIYGPLNKDLPFAYTLDRLRQTIMTPEHASIGK